MIPNEAELRRCDFQNFRVHGSTVYFGYDRFYYTRDNGQRGSVGSYRELIRVVAPGKSGTPQPVYLIPPWPVSKSRLMK